MNSSMTGVLTSPCFWSLKVSLVSPELVRMLLRNSTLENISMFSAKSTTRAAEGSAMSFLTSSRKRANSSCFMRTPFFLDQRANRWLGL